MEGLVSMWRRKTGGERGHGRWLQLAGWSQCEAVDGVMRIEAVGRAEDGRARGKSWMGHDDRAAEEKGMSGVFLREGGLRVCARVCWLACIHVRGSDYFTANRWLEMFLRPDR